MRSWMSATNLFGSVMVIAHESICLFSLLSCHRRTPQRRDRHGLPVASREVIRLFAIRRVLPLVVTRGRHEAAIALERIAEERLLLNRLGTRVERRDPHLLERLGPPARDQTPTHPHELAPGGDGANDTHRV